MMGSRVLPWVLAAMGAVAKALEPSKKVRVPAGDALRTSADVLLPGGLTIRAITAPYFLGTKIEAFRGRGHGDYFASHDLEDFVAVIDGRRSLLQEVQEVSPELRAFIGEAVRTLLDASRFRDALPGYLPPDAASQARIGQLSRTLDELSRLAPES